jgi:hypothetical protein
MMAPHPPGQPQMPTGGTGAASAPRPQMGNGAAALTLIHTAVEALQKSLVGLPMGTELHTKVLKAIVDLSKGMDNGGGDSASQIQALAAMGRDIQSNPQAAIMQKMFPQGAQNQPPAMPG